MYSIDDVCEFGAEVYFIKRKYIWMRICVSKCVSLGVVFSCVCQHFHSSIALLISTWLQLKAHRAEA